MFFFQRSNILLQSLLLCIVSEEKSNVILTLLSYRQGSFLSFSFFFFYKIFSLTSYSLNMIYTLGVGVLVSVIAFSELSGILVWCLSLIVEKLSAIIT